MKAQLIKQLTELLTEPSAMEVVAANQLLLEATFGLSRGVTGYCRTIIQEADRLGVDAEYYRGYIRDIMQHKLSKQDAERLATDIVTYYGGFLNGKNQLSAG